MSDLIDRERFSADMRDFQNRVGIWRDEAEDTETWTRADAALATIIETKLILDKQPTIAASPWHRVEDGLYAVKDGVLYQMKVRTPEGKTIKMPPIKFTDAMRYEPPRRDSI